MNTFWWIVVLVIAVLVSNFATVFFCRHLHLQFKVKQRHLMMLKVFGVNFERLTDRGVFEISKFRNDLQAVMDIVGLEWHTHFNIFGKDFDQIERAGSIRLCRAILDCMEHFSESRYIDQDCEFRDFYNIKEHGGANERTFEYLEVTLRDRLEDLKMTLMDFSESENSLNHCRDFWRTYGLLKPFSIHASP